jgi:hypothetical protein
LPAAKEEDLAKLSEPVDIAGQPAQLYDQDGEDAAGDKTRILAATLRREDVAWFFKMTGPDQLVAQQKPAFVEFLKSVSFSAPMAQAALPPSHPPIDSGAMPPAMAAPSSEPASPKPDWQVPPGWQETSGGQFLLAKFVISGDANSQAAVNVSRSAGMGGGVLANVNRWRGQLGLAPWTETDLDQQCQTLDIAGTRATVVDMTGADPRTSQPARLVAAIIPQADQTWFYKLMGNTDIVAKQKETFIKFVQSAKYQ